MSRNRLDVSDEELHSWNFKLRRMTFKVVFYSYRIILLPVSITLFILQTVGSSLDRFSWWVYRLIRRKVTDRLSDWLNRKLYGKWMTND